jgi:hypothetical protein
MEMVAVSVGAEISIKNAAVNNLWKKLCTARKKAKCPLPSGVVSEKLREIKIDSL